MAVLLRFPSLIFTFQHPQSLLLQNPLKINPIFSLHRLSPISHTPQRNPLPLYSSSSSSLSSSPLTLETPPPETTEPIPNPARLIAQNIPWDATPDDIRTLFELHGTVIDLELSMHNKTRNRGLAFVTMGTEEEAREALSKLDSYEIEGRTIKVEFARSLKRKPSPAKNHIAKYNVFVGNLAWGVKSSDLRELFGAPNDTVLFAEVVYQSNPRRPAGYGFVSFYSKKAAEAAISAFNGQKLMGRAIRLEFTRRQLRQVPEFEGLKENRQLKTTLVKKIDDMAEEAD